MPIFSDLTSLSLYYAGSSNPYLSSSPYSTSPSSYRSPLPSRYGAPRSYTPHLATIGETTPLTSRRVAVHSSAITRINSPKTRLLSSTSSSGISSPYRISRPISINTDDIDVSRNRYKHRRLQRDSEFKSSPTSSYVSSISTSPTTSSNLSSYSNYSNKNDSNKQTTTESNKKTDLPANRSTIKRGRTVVRFHTKRLKENPYLVKQKSEDNGTQDANNNIQNEIDKQDIQSVVSALPIEKTDQEVTSECIPIETCATDITGSSIPDENDDRLAFDQKHGPNFENNLREIRRNSAEILQEHLKLLDVILKQEEIPPQVNLSSSRTSVKRKKKPSVKKKLSKDLSVEDVNKSPIIVAKKIADTKRSSIKQLSKVSMVQTKPKPKPKPKPKIINTSVEVEEKPNLKFTVGDVLVESTTTPTKKKAFTFEVSVEVEDTKNIPDTKTKSQAVTNKKPLKNETAQEDKLKNSAATKSSNNTKISAKQNKTNDNFEQITQDHDLSKQQTNIQKKIHNLETPTNKVTESNNTTEQTNLDQTKFPELKETSKVLEENPSLPVKTDDIPSKSKPKLTKEDNFESDDIDFWETIGKRETIRLDRKKQILQDEVAKQSIPSESENVLLKMQSAEVKDVFQNSEVSIPQTAIKAVAQTNLDITTAKRKSPEVKEVCKISETSPANKVAQKANLDQAVTKLKTAEVKEIPKISNTSPSTMKKDNIPSKENSQLLARKNQPANKNEMPKILEDKKPVIKPKEKTTLVKKESFGSNEVDFWETIGKRETVRFEKRKEVLKEEEAKRLRMMLEDSIEKSTVKELDFSEKEKEINLSPVPKKDEVPKSLLMQTKIELEPQKLQTNEADCSTRVTVTENEISAEKKPVQEKHDNSEKSQNETSEKQNSNEISKIITTMKEVELSKPKEETTPIEKLEMEKIPEKKPKEDERKSSFGQSKSLDNEISGTITSKLVQSKQSKSADEVEKIISDTDKNKIPSLIEKKTEEQVGKKVADIKSAKTSNLVQKKSENQAETKAADVKEIKISSLVQNKDENQVKKKVVEAKCPKISSLGQQQDDIEKLETKNTELSSSKPLNQAQSKSVDQIITTTKLPNITSSKSADKIENKIVDQKGEAEKQIGKKQISKTTRIEETTTPVINSACNEKQSEKNVSDKPVETKKLVDVKPPNKISTTESKTTGKSPMEKHEKDDSSKLKHSKNESKIMENSKEINVSHGNQKKLPSKVSDKGKEKQIKTVEPKEPEAKIKEDKNTEVKTETTGKCEQTKSAEPVNSTVGDDKEKSLAQKEVAPSPVQKTDKCTTNTNTTEPKNDLGNVIEQPLSKIFDVLQKPTESPFLNLLLQANNKPKPARAPPKDTDTDLILYATPRDLYRPPPRRRQPYPLSSFSESSTESSDDSESSDDEDDTESSSDEGTSSTSDEDGEESDTVVNEDKRTSTSSNDSGFHSSVPSSPANCNRNHVSSSSENRDSPTSPPSHNPAFALESPCGSSKNLAAIHQNDPYSEAAILESSHTYTSYQRSGRVTPPATTIPRFRKYTIDDFHFLKVLGKGSFGKVLLAELKDTEYYYAVKCLKKDVVLEDDDVECTLIERKVLALGTKHPYLCHLFCTFQTESHLFFVMEYLNGGDLMFHIQQSGRFPEPRAKFYGAEIVSGLKFLHKKGIVYRDLKLDNILLDFEGHVRIADFGMCKLQIYLDRTADTFCGTPDYMAPEIIKGQHYNQCVDWWSFGVLLYEMLIGQSPFSGCDEDELFWSICNERPVLPRYLTTEASNILSMLLEKDSSKRLGSPECLVGDISDHIFFRSIDWLKLEQRQLLPPFKPNVQHPLDTQYFDKVFTTERAKLTPVDQEILRSMDQTQFHGFSYTNPNVTDH